MGNDWADLVFHVLAHVRPAASLPASVYDARYIADMAMQLDDAATRHLGEDAATLGRILSDHETLASVQLLAWLFHSGERAARCVDRELSELGTDDVDAPHLLLRVQELGAPIEVLRCACDLEREVHARRTRSASDLTALAAALEEVTRAAPWLSRCRVKVVPALRLRGRVLDDEIWIGEAPADHAAWQAAHEATVAEVAAGRGARGEAHDHYAVEQAAIALLLARADEQGLASAHRRWLDHLDLRHSATSAAAASDGSTEAAGSTGEGERSRT